MGNDECNFSISFFKDFFFFLLVRFGEQVTMQRRHLCFPPWKCHPVAASKLSHARQPPAPARPGTGSGRRGAARVKRGTGIATRVRRPPLSILRAQDAHSRDTRGAWSIDRWIGGFSWCSTPCRVASALCRNLACCIELKFVVIHYTSSTLYIYSFRCLP